MSEHSEDPVETHKHESDFDQPRINNISQKFLADLDEERKALGNKFPLCALLIDEAFDRVYTTGRIPGKEFYADVYKQKPIKITQKVFVPIKQYPKFNFSGKILGPKGNSLRRLQEETQCKIVIKGRNSVRDRTKEEEMRNSSDPRYAHLHKDLFVEISTVATPAESYARISYALGEIRKYLVPDKNDEVSHEQLRELMEIDPKLAKPYNKSVYDRKISASGGAPKFLNLIKRASHSLEQAEHDEQGEHEEETHGYESHIRKRPFPSAYEHEKAKTIPSTSAYKRLQATVHDTELKRLRESPYKPSAYGIIRKYK